MRHPARRGAPRKRPAAQLLPRPRPRYWRPEHVNADRDWSSPSPMRKLGFARLNLMWRAAFGHTRGRPAGYRSLIARMQAEAVAKRSRIAGELADLGPKLVQPIPDVGVALAGASKGGLGALDQE